MDNWEIVQNTSVAQLVKEKEHIISTDLDYTGRNTMLHVCHLLQLTVTCRLSLSGARCAATEHPH
jgi:hypothetical protein